MAKSSIPKLATDPRRGALAEAIGAELRYRRRHRGFTQRELGAPFTLFVFAGRFGTLSVRPGVAADRGRLGIGLDDFTGVNARWTRVLIRRMNATASRRRVIVDAPHWPPTSVRASAVPA
jgi:hypothetical protein